MTLRDQPSVLGMLVRAVIRGVIIAFVILAGIVVFDTVGPPACRNPRILDGPLFTDPPDAGGPVIRARLLPHDTLLLNGRLVAGPSQRKAWLERLASPYRNPEASAALEIQVRGAFDARHRTLQQLVADAFLKRVGVARIRLAPPARSATRTIRSWIVVEPLPKSRDKDAAPPELFAVTADPKDLHRVTIVTPTGGRVELNHAEDSDDESDGVTERDGLGTLTRAIRAAIDSAPAQPDGAQVLFSIDGSTPYSAVRLLLEAAALAAQDSGAQDAGRVAVALTSPKAPSIEILVSKHDP